MTNLIFSILLATAFSLNPTEQAAVTKIHDQIAVKLAPTAKQKLHQVAHSVIGPANAGDAARLGVTTAFREASLGENDINTLTIFVLAEAAKSTDNEINSLTNKVAKINQQKASLRQTANAEEKTKETLKNKLDSLNEMGEMESLRLQMAMDRMSKMMQTLSNLLKKTSDTASSIVQNLK